MNEGRKEGKRDGGEGKKRKWVIKDDVVYIVC